MEVETQTVFLLKLDKDGNRRISSYYGGSMEDFVRTVATAEGNRIFIAGESKSSNAIATPNAHQSTNPLNGRDAFIVKFQECSEVTVEQIDTVLQASLPFGNYQWIDCDQGSVISGENNSFFIPSQSGNYAVIVQDGICADTSECVYLEVEVVGLTDKERSNQQITIYPNPSRDALSIDGLKANVNYRFQLVDLTGRLVLEQPSNSDYTLDVSEIPSGTYFLRIISSSELQVLKMVKE